MPMPTLVLLGLLTCTNLAMSTTSMTTTASTLPTSTSNTANSTVSEVATTLISTTVRSSTMPSTIPTPKEAMKPLAIVGVIVGVSIAVVIIGIIIGCVIVRRRRQKRRDSRHLNICDTHEVEITTTEMESLRTPNARGSAREDVIAGENDDDDYLTPTPMMPRRSLSSLPDNAVSPEPDVEPGNEEYENIASPLAEDVGDGEAVGDNELYENTGAELVVPSDEIYENTTPTVSYVNIPKAQLGHSVSVDSLGNEYYDFSNADFLPNNSG